MTRNGKEKVLRRTALAIMSTALVLQAISSPQAVSGDEPRPPDKYALTDVSFEFAEGGYYARVSVRIDGNGKGTVTSGSSLGDEPPERFTVDSATIADLVQACHRGGFFSLQSSYGPPNGVVVADGAWSSITVRIGSYRKSVGYLKGFDAPPPVLTDLETRIQRARGTGPKK